MEGESFSYNILTSLITIGDFDPTYSRSIQAKYAFTECTSIEINDSYETLTNTAVVTLPREVLLSTSEKDATGERVTPVLSDARAVFQMGQRIIIALGYDGNNKVLFDGFITNIEAKSPFVLHCEDFGWKLKKMAVSNLITTGKSAKINDVLPSLLEGSGIDIQPYTKKMDLQIGQIYIEKSKSLGEVLEQWKRNYGLLSFIKFYNGKPYLALSRTYFSTNQDQTLIDGETAIVPTADFQDNVTDDDLSFIHLDYDTLAVEATTIFKDNSRYRLSIILNKDYAAQKADYDLGKTKKVPDEFLVVNESKISKKQAKEDFKNAKQVKDNVKNIRNIQDRFDMTKYNVRTYHEYNLDRDTLIKNAKAKFKSISQTGIDGSVTIFGDFGMRAASMIRLYDERNPEKNGLYVVSEVNTKFGTGGYRQKLKIPYKRGQ